MVDTENYIIYIFEDETVYENNNYYEDITKNILNSRIPPTKNIGIAKYVIKNNKRYYVNKQNKINHKNKEEENAKWFIELFGGKLDYLPDINEEPGIQCADYRYYPVNSKKSYYIEEKETYGKSKNVFYHALEGKEKQANIFIIDCTNSNFTDSDIYECLNYVFKSSKMSYIKIIIIKNGNKLFGVFKKRDNTL